MEVQTRRDNLISTQGDTVGRHEQARVGVRLDLLGERQARRVRRDPRLTPRLC